MGSSGQEDTNFGNEPTFAPESGGDPFSTGTLEEGIDQPLVTSQLPVQQNAQPGVPGGGGNPGNLGQSELPVPLSEEQAAADKKQQDAIDDAKKAEDKRLADAKAKADKADATRAASGQKRGQDVNRRTAQTSGSLGGTLLTGNLGVTSNANRATKTLLGF